MDQESFIPKEACQWTEPAISTPRQPSLHEILQMDESVDAIIDEPRVLSNTTLKYTLPEPEGRELRPGRSLVFMVPEEFKNKREAYLRDLVLMHRKGEKYVKDIGSDRHDPYGAYSRVEVHDQETGQWVQWVDPKGYSPDKFAEPRPSADPENEVLHDWVATVGKIRPDAIKVTNVGQSPDYSVSQVHGVEMILFPELEGVKYNERIYTPGTSFIDLENNQSMPTYGGGSRTEGIYTQAIPLNLSSQPLYELGHDPGPEAQLTSTTLKIDLQPGQKIVQIEVSVGDTEHLDHINPKTNRQTRLGYSKLWVGIEKAGSGNIDWFIQNANIPPQGVIAGGPKPELSQVEQGDKLVIEARQDTAYVMGWRVAYENKSEESKELLETSGNSLA
jgi:hypothetical protein